MKFWHFPIKQKHLTPHTRKAKKRKESFDTKVFRAGKRLTIPQLKKKCWKLFSIYIRMRGCLETTGSLEYGECFTCDNPPQHEFRNLQAGHFIAGRHNANLFSEKGTQLQCRRCNIFLHGAPLEFRKRLIEKYGEGIIEELENEAHQVKRFTIPELLSMIDYYKERIEFMKAQNKIPVLSELTKCL